MRYCEGKLPLAISGDKHVHTHKIATPPMVARNDETNPNVQEFFKSRHEGRFHLPFFDIQTLHNFLISIYKRSWISLSYLMTEIFVSINIP